MRLFLVAFGLCALSLAAWSRAGEPHAQAGTWAWHPESSVLWGGATLKLLLERVFVGAAAPEAAFTIHLDRSAGAASPLLYGCSLAAPGSPQARLLSPELLRNGSFEMIPPGKVLPYLPEGWSAAPGWQLVSCGPKRIIVRSEPGYDDPLVLVRGRLWKSYQVSLLARKTGGPGGLRILFEVQDAENHLRWTLGAGGNRWHVLESMGRGTPRELAPPVVGRIEPGRAYRIDISVRDNVISCSLDGRVIHRLGEAQFPTAGIGLGAADATAEYFDLTARGAPDLPLFLLDEPADAAKDSLSAGWQPMCSPGNAAGYRWEFVYPFNSQFSQRIGVEKYAGGDAGIRQGGIPVAAGGALRGWIHWRGTAGLAAEVSLRSRDGRVYARQELKDIRLSWTPCELSLVPSSADAAADFCLSLKGTGTIWVDEVSLVRGEDFGPLGLRREAVDALRALRPAVLRWPAGPAAANYDWRRGLGPRSQRPIVAVGRPPGTVGQADRGTGFPGTLEAAPNDFGTDEFLALCKELGAAPLLVANPILGSTANLDGLEYCNGAAGTVFGKRRAANGHAEPYGVRLWQVPAELPRGKEEGKRPEARGARGEGETAKKVPSGPVPPASGTPPSSREPRPSLSRALREQDSTIRVLEDHRDWVPTGPGLAASAAVTLNRLSREGGPDAVAACPWVASVKAPTEGLLSAGPAGLKRSPAYQVLQLFRGHPVQELCAMDGPAPASKIDLLVGRSGKEVVIRAANCGEAEVQIAIAFDGLGPSPLAPKAEHFRIRGDGDARLETEAVPVAGNKLAFTSPPRSVHVLVLRLP